MREVDAIVSAAERGLVLVLGIVIFAAASSGFAQMGDAGRAGKPAQKRVASEEVVPARLVSLNPSLTAIVMRLGMGKLLVGVDDYSIKLFPELGELPRVGGLFDPGLESILSLRPDRVLLVAGVDQQEHAKRLARVGLKVEVYRNERLDEVLENIARLGALLDRRVAASNRIQAISKMRRAILAVSEKHPRPRTVAIVDRSPLFLVGAETYLDEMLGIVGAENLARSVAVGYPRGSIEWLIAARPDLLLDMTPGAEAAAKFWARWPSIPAVASNRVAEVDVRLISLPGPDLDDALRALAISVHGDAISIEIDRALALAPAEPTESDRHGGTFEADPSASSPSLPMGRGEDSTLRGSL